MNDIEKAIEVLKMENELMQFNPTTGEIEPIELQNEDNQDLYNANLIAIQALEKQLNGGWIPVKKKLPDTNKDILVTLNDGKVVPARYLFADNLNHITAWQPLPPAYKEVENE